MKAAAALSAVKLVHTVAWAVFASAIVAILPAAIMGERRLAQWLMALVSVECLVLAANRMRCPLTDVAARYTADRRDNFDICLPVFVARYNKVIFGSLFALDIAVVTLLWL